MAATKKAPALTPRPRIARPPAVRAPVAAPATPPVEADGDPDPTPPATPAPTREDTLNMSDKNTAVVTLSAEEELALASVVAAAAATIAKAEADSASALESLYRAGVGSIVMGGVSYTVRHTRSGWRAVPPSAPKARAQRRAVTV